MRRVLLIANPISGSGRNVRRCEHLTQALRAVGIAASSEFTKERGHAVELARRASSEDFETVVAVGGDGTLREVADGLEGRIPVAICPTGTANVMARDLGMPFPTEGVARVVQRRNVVKIDTARCNGRLVLFVVGAGFDAEILHELESVRSGGISYFTYLRPIANALLRYRPAPLRVSVDGGKFENCNFVIVSNTRHYAGPWIRFRTGPQLTDGVFEVYRFIAPTIASLGAAMIRGVSGRLPGGSVGHSAGKFVQIESADSTPIQIDGDTAGTTPANIEVSRQTLPILAPDDFPIV